jgi:sugar lactone lactonase YvrE
LDSADNLYVADYGCGRIRKVDANTGIMSSVVGTGVQGFSGDGGLATNAQLQLPHGLVVDSVGNMYIADTANHRVRKVDASTGIITTIAGTGVQGFYGDGGPATDAQLYYPTYVSVDCAGNLFISDNGNRRIRKVAAAVPLCLPPVSAAVPVPSLSIPGLALLTLMLGAFAALRQRRA